MKHLFLTMLIALVIATCSCRTPIDRSEDVLMEEDVRHEQGCPPSLAKCRTLSWAQYVDINFLVYRIPKPDDAKGTQCGIDRVDHLLLTAGANVTLPFALGDALHPEDSGHSQVVLLEPFNLIATDDVGDKWLLSVRRQDAKVTISRLENASTTPPHDVLLWETLDEPVYHADDTLIHEFLRKQKQ